MRPHPAWLLLFGPAIAFAQTPTGRGQTAPIPVPAQLVVLATPEALGAEQLDRLIAPFAGAPQDVLGIVLDACRYPAVLLEAVAWLRQPEAARGLPSQAWPPTIRTLAEHAPRTLEYLTQDIATTAALGSAYQNQPNDVWFAYGRMTAREAEARAPLQEPSPGVSPQAGPAAATPAGAVRAPASPVAGTAPGPAPVVSQLQPAAPPQAATPAAAPASTGISPAGAALVGGVVGLAAGLLIGEIANNNNDEWRTPYGRPYPVPVPYAPYPPRYAGGSPYAGTGQRYDAARVMQDDRQAAGREMQSSRQSAAAARQGSSQAALANRQAGRQEGTASRQQTRRDDAAGAAAQRPPASLPPGGPERRTAATGERARPQAPAPSARPNPTRPPPARAAPEWGPARGMAGGDATARARQPPAAAAGPAERGGGARRGGRG